MKKEEFEEKLFKYFNENKRVPKEINNAIWEVKLNKRNENKFVFNLKRIAAIVASICTLTTGMVFAKDINQFISNIFNDGKGVETAVEYNYIEEVLNATCAESQNTKFTATQMLFDNHTLDINFMVEFDSNIDLTKMEEYFEIPDLLITDENNNILHYSDIEKAQEFRKQKGLKSERIDVLNESINSGIPPFAISKIIGNNSCNFTLKCYSYDATFPNCEKLYFTFTKIVLTENAKNITINGNWKMEITVPEKFKNREPIIYKIKDCSSDLFNVTNEIYPTCTKIGLTINNVNYEKWHKEADKIRQEGNVLDSQFVKLEKCYIENDKGQKFYIANIPEHNPYGLNDDGELILEATFDLTEFNLTNKLRVVLFTLENEEIIINLEK